MLLEGQIAVVTGASRGIGRAIAILLAEHGCDVAFNYVANDAAANDLVTKIVSLGRSAFCVKADVADNVAVSAFIQSVIERFGRIDVLVNNAGITRDNLLLMMDDADISEVVNTNLLGTIYCTRAAAIHMVRKRRGRIINISSTAARKPGRGQANYAASKGGVEAFTKAMAVELSPKKVQVNAVAPGLIETDMTQRVRDMGEQEIMQRLLLKRYGQATEIAEAVLFLANPNCSYITGQVITVDGGLKMA